MRKSTRIAILGFVLTLSSCGPPADEIADFAVTGDAEVESTVTLQVTQRAKLSETSKPTENPTVTHTATATHTATHTAQPTQTATDAPTHTATHVPIQTASPFVSQITFSNIVSLRQEIPRVVWESAKNEVKSNYESSRSLVELKVLVGPNTTLYFNDNEEAYRDAIAFWAQFPQPPEYIALSYNFEDKPWAVSEFKKLPFYWEGMERAVEAPCEYIPEACNGANAGIYGSSGVGVGVVGIYPPDASDPYRLGPLQIHEYTHAVQAAPWIGEGDPNRGHQTLPSACWLGEGQAHLAGLAVGSDSLEEYLQIRKRQVRSHPVEGFNDYSAAAILEYYRDTDCIPGKSPEYDLGYTIGYLTVEALSAIAGPTSSMGLNTRAALYGVGEVTGKEFNQIFQNVYGISWDEAMPILAEVVAQTFKELP